MDERTGEVVRILDRYIVEIVIAYNFCPWAAAARREGEIAIEVLFGTPDAPEFGDALREALSRPKARVAMVVAPELYPTQADLRRVRDVLTKRVGGVGVADFHPHAPCDLQTAGRAVPFTRRAPDALIQALPLAILDQLRVGPPPQDRARQLAMLGGYIASPRADLADKIADDNHATLVAQLAKIQATMDDIAADRAASYARVGIRLPAAPPPS